MTLMPPQPSIAHTPFAPSPYEHPSTTSPLPTPPSSTTVIPAQCFPSPTSVADIVNIHPHSQSPRSKSVQAAPPVRAARPDVSATPVQTRHSQQNVNISSHKHPFPKQQQQEQQHQQQRLQQSSQQAQQHPLPPQPPPQEQQRELPNHQKQCQEPPPPPPPTPSSSFRASSPHQLPALAHDRSPSPSSTQPSAVRPSPDSLQPPTSANGSPRRAAHIRTATSQPQPSASHSPPLHAQSLSVSPSSQLESANIPNVTAQLPPSHSPVVASSSDSDSASDTETEPCSQATPTSPTSSVPDSVPHSLLSTQSACIHALAAQSDDQIPYFYPHLANKITSPSLPPVTKSQFSSALDTFIKEHPPDVPVTDAPTYVASLRCLLDHLDNLAEQQPLRQTNHLFQVLSTIPGMRHLLFLLSDISTMSHQAPKDVRKVYRYPYLVSAILANGNMEIREAFVGNADLVHRLLSFIDGDVPLHPSAADLLASGHPPAMARDNEIIVVQVVQVLVSYLDTSPDAVMHFFERRATWVPALVNMLHIGAVPKLLVDMIPETSVHQLTTTDHAMLSFHAPLTSGLKTLANAEVFHLLADAYVRAAQTILSNVGMEGDGAKATHRAHQLAYNITDVYDGLLTKLVRAVRINPTMPACQYLNVYGNASTAGTLTDIVTAACHLFRMSSYEQTSVLCGALVLLLRVLRVLQHDRDLRVPSVMGPPPDLATEALEAEMRPVLQALLDLLIDLVGSTDSGHAMVQVHILDVFVEFCRIASTETMKLIHGLRFGEIAVKMVCMHSRNSMLHHVVCRAVEDALIGRGATMETAKHWLVQSALMGRVVMIWMTEKGTERWGQPKCAQEAPFLSAVVHMACCVHHWLAMEGFGEGDYGEDGETGGGGGLVGGLVGVEIAREFERFWVQCMEPIMAEEKPVGGVRPRKKGSRGAVASTGVSFGLGGASARMMRWAGASRNVGPAWTETSASGGAGGGGLGRLSGIFERTSLSDDAGEGGGKCGSGLGGGAGDLSGGGCGGLRRRRSSMVRSGSAHRFGYVEAGGVVRNHRDDIFVEGEDDFGECESVASLFDVGDGVG